MKPLSPVLDSLARRYERSKPGRTGTGERDLLIRLEELLAESGCAEGENRARAELDLLNAEKEGLLVRVPLNKKDRSLIFQIRFAPEKEKALYGLINRPSPAHQREQLAAQFLSARDKTVPNRWKTSWQKWCDHRATEILAGGSPAPFDREPSDENFRLLKLIPLLLAWEGESLVRFASCVLCGNSKTLQELAGIERDGPFAHQLRGKLGRLLEEITNGQIASLDALGIVSNPRSVLIHGPIQLRWQDKTLDLGMLHGPFQISQTDVEQADEIHTTARRCLTIENETTFHELAKLQSGELLCCTSYPGSATVTFLKRLSDQLEYWHFGDSDSAGFEILRVLRGKTGRNFQPLHMQPGRQPFEQESFGRPTSKNWPFY
jgi:hypothetical protein